jgi:hypothetical protein
MENYELEIGRNFRSRNKVKVERSISELAEYTWKNMNNRVGKGCYKNVEIKWEKGAFIAWFICQEAVIAKIKASGKVVSIDRIDSRKGYSEDNCRLIPNDLNVALGQINGLHSQLKKLYEYIENNKEWL